MTLHITAPSSDLFQRMFSVVWSFSSVSLVVVNFENNLVLDCTGRGSTFASLCVQHNKYTWSNNLQSRFLCAEVHVLFLSNHFYFIHKYRKEQSELLVHVETFSCWYTGAGSSILFQPFGLCRGWSVIQNSWLLLSAFVTIWELRSFWLECTLKLRDLFLQPH